MDALTYFEAVSDSVYERFEENDCDFDRLPEEVAIFHRVQEAQGVIDNGGLIYFFENNWDGNPPYSAFVDAYRVIGCDAAARCIEDAANSFPFPDPHLHLELRRQYMEQSFNEELHQVSGWDNSICGDESVYPALGTFAAKHADKFRLRGK